MPRIPQFPRYPAKKHATGQARITLEGKDHYLGLFGSADSCREYERLRADWAARRASPGAAPTAPPGTVEPPGGLTVAALVLRFLEHADRHYRDADGQPTTEMAGWRASLGPLDELHGPTPAARFGPLALKAVRQAMVGRGWSRKVVNQRVGRLKRLFKWGASEELVPGSVYEALRAVQGLQEGRTEAPEMPEVAPAPAWAVEAVLPHLTAVLRAMVLVQLWSGMRPGEVCRLTPGEIDRDGLSVDGVEVWVYRPRKHKTRWRGRAKAVVIGPRAQAALLPFLARPADAFCFSPAESEAERGRGRLGERAPGRRWTAQTYAKAVACACRKVYGPLPAGYDWPDWSPGQLRHSAATEIASRHGIEGARAVLGHAQVNTTRIYAERDLRQAAEIVARFG